MIRSLLTTVIAVTMCGTCLAITEVAIEIVLSATNFAILKGEIR